MSHAFLLELHESVIKFLGTVPASSLKKPNPKDGEEDDQFKGLENPDEPELDIGQSGNQAGAFNPDDHEDDQNLDLDPDLQDEAGNQTDPDLADETVHPLEGESDQPEQDPDKMGDIRTVKGAHLVFKRQNSDGTFTELWMYNIGKHVDDAIAVKRAILAGTDIKDGKLRSEDGKQMYQLSTLGNAQLLSIDGLSN